MVGAHWHIGYGRQKPIHCRLLSDENPTILTTNNNNTTRYKPHHQVTTKQSVCLSWKNLLTMWHFVWKGPLNVNLPLIQSKYFYFGNSSYRSAIFPYTSVGLVDLFLLLVYSHIWFGCLENVDFVFRMKVYIPLYTKATLSIKREQTKQNAL